MHEFSLAEEMTAAIADTLGGPVKLSSVTVVIGPLSGVSPESLAFCFSAVAGMKGFGRPELVIRNTEAKMHCRDCGSEWFSRDFTTGCPDCGSWNRNIMSGREFYVESVDLPEEGADEDKCACDGQEQ